VIAYIAVQLLVWHQFYAADPWLLTGPVILMLWATAAVAYLRRRWPAWQVAGLDSIVHLAVALGATWCVPPAMRGDAANWLYIAMAGQLFIPTWFAPTVVAGPLAIASAAVYWTSSVLSATAAARHNSPAAAAALLLAIAAANWCGRRMLYRWVARTDAALARADTDARAQYVVLTRNIERREHERLLHDTVLNTLTALAHAGSSDMAVGRCRHDVTLMEYVLGDPGAARRARRPCDGLLVSIEAVANEMRARGLTVHLTANRGAPAGAEPARAGIGLTLAGCEGVPAGREAVPAVPVPVAAAMAHAVREALTNVISHAGTGEAWVEVAEEAPGAESTATASQAGRGDLRARRGGVQVTVRDAGAGFDTARVDPARLGLRRSIVERIADSGGLALIRSVPGEGTEVSMRWAPPARCGQPSVAGASPPAAEPAHPGGQPMLPDMSKSELPRTVGTVALVWQFALLIQVLIDLRDYRQPVVPFAVWLGMLAAAGWLVPRVRAGGLSGTQAAVAIAVAATAVALVGWNRAPGATGTVDWSVFGTGWLLMLVAVSRPFWVWLSGGLLIFAVHAVFAIRLLGVTPLGLARLAVTVYTLAVIMAVFAALRPTVHTQAIVAARSAALASRSAAERAATAAVKRDRRERLALLEAAALPLLRGIGDTSLDPADSDVRERCSRHAAALRHALVDRAQNAAGLLAELEPALSAAQERGLPVEIQVVGDPGCPVREVAGATLAAVDGVMRALPPQPVTLTVLASGDDVELFVTFDLPPRPRPDVAELRRKVPASARWRAVVDVDDTGSGCLEVRWWKAIPA
jgi:signal transduction histidine kinase